MIIPEIADAVGVNCATIFSHLFNRISGLPLRRYRKLVMDV
jgi:transcriptional regulator GlxA family with amidase domain